MIVRDEAVVACSTEGNIPDSSSVILVFDTFVVVSVDIACAFESDRLSPECSSSLKVGVIDVALNSSSGRRSEGDGTGIGTASASAFVVSTDSILIVIVSSAPFDVVLEFADICELFVWSSNDGVFESCDGISDVDDGASCGRLATIVSTPDFSPKWPTKPVDSLSLRNSAASSSLSCIAARREKSVVGPSLSHASIKVGDSTSSSFGTAVSTPASAKFDLGDAGASSSESAGGVQEYCNLEGLTIAFAFFLDVSEALDAVSESCFLFRRSDSGVVSWAPTEGVEAVLRGMPKASFDVQPFLSAFSQLWQRHSIFPLPK